MIFLILFVSAVSCSHPHAVRKLTIPSKNTHPACKRNDIFHSDIVEDHSLKKGINPQNFTFLGVVPTMPDCMALCCSAKNCNIAYMKNNSCYSVSCPTSENCEVENGTLTMEDSGTKLALIIRNEINRRVYVTAYLIVVVCAFGAAMSGTVWAVFIFYKRYSVVSGDKKGPPEGSKDVPLDPEKPVAKRMHY